ncbi:MAG: thioredoxin family protein [Planctomycetaceae bacterium]
MKILEITTLVAAVLTSVSVDAGKYNPVLNIGDKAPAWKQLPGTDGKQHALSDLKDKAVVVVVFTCNSCPYAVDYEDRLIAFTARHTKPDSPVALVAINVNTVKEDLPEQMKKRAQAKGFTFPYLFDGSQQIAKAYGAGATPEFFVLDSARRVVYMGAMDDNSDASQVQRKHVDLAVKAALSGKRPAVTETVPIGCRIRFARRRRKKS